jgi:hypothetical protein
VRCRAAWRARTSLARVTRRCAAQTSSIWAAVACCAQSTNVAIVVSVAILLIARTFEYDNRPAPNASTMTGKVRIARATRTCSRAVLRPIPHCQDNQCDVERIPHDPQPSAASNSPINTNSRQVAAASCEHNATMSASRRSNGRGNGA